MHLRVILLSFILSLPLLTVGQEINNSLSFKNINSDTYFRINYENDVLRGSDQYYTQGIRAELVQPWVQRFPLSRLLLRPSGSYIRYGLALEHNCYTPTSIGSDVILYNDHPYAASLLLHTFQVSIDSSRPQRISSDITLGVIGPAAFGMDLQTNVHRLIHNSLPKGWEYQLHNDAIVNYQVGYERKLFSWDKYLMLDAGASAYAGTFNDRATLGSTIMLGYFDDPYNARTASWSNLRVYGYFHPEVAFVAYDATLQGGLFNRSSPYSVAAADIQRVVFQDRVGIVAVYRRLYLEYFLAMQGRTFKGGEAHGWGGFQLAWGL